MFSAKFAYNEPGMGEIDVEGEEVSMSNEDIIKVIEEKYPEYIDIEILSTEDWN